MLKKLPRSFGYEKGHCQWVDHRMTECSHYCFSGRLVKVFSFWLVTSLGNLPSAVWMPEQGSSRSLVISFVVVVVILTTYLRLGPYKERKPLELTALEAGSPKSLVLALARAALWLMTSSQKYMQEGRISLQGVTGKPEHKGGLDIAAPKTPLYPARWRTQPLA